MSQVENMQNPPRSHDEVLTWTRLWGCRPCCRSTEVIGICIRHDAPAPKPRRLNKHLEIICVHLGLLFCSAGPAVALRYPVLVGQLSTAPSQPNGIHCKSTRRFLLVSSWAFSGIISEKKIRKHFYYAARWLFPRSRTGPGFSLFPPSTYLPETPFPGCWPSQFASSLSKHFTGERLDLHPPHCQPPHSGTRAHTHT